jgi:hypothetical protein
VTLLSRKADLYSKPLEQRSLDDAAPAQCRPAGGMSAKVFVVSG